MFYKAKNNITYDVDKKRVFSVKLKLIYTNYVW
jgi:hypothetical protein